MNYKNITLFGLLLLTAQTCLTIDYRTVGRRTFKTVVGIPAVTYIMHKAQSPSRTKDSLAYHEAAHAVIATKLDSEVFIVHAKISKFYSLTPECYVRVGMPVNLPKDNLVKFYLASVTAMQQSKKIQAQQRFIEQELNLPISNLGNNRNNIGYGYHWQFGGDMRHALQASLDLADQNNSPEAQLEEAVNVILPRLYQETAQLTQKYQPEIQRVADALREKEYLTGDEIKKLIDQTK